MNMLNEANFDRWVVGGKRHKEDVSFRGTYRAPRWLLLSRVVSCATIVAWTHMSPTGPGLRYSGCVSLGQTCIIILDIALHILIIGELDIVFC